MKKEVLAQLNSPHLPIIGLVLFITVFVGAVIWSYRRDAKKVYSEAEQLPLEDGTLLSSSKGVK